MQTVEELKMRRASDSNICLCSFLRLWFVLSLSMQEADVKKEKRVRELVEEKHQLQQKCVSSGLSWCTVGGVHVVVTGRSGEWLLAAPGAVFPSGAGDQETVQQSNQAV